MEVNWAAKAVSCSLIMTVIFLKVSRHLMLWLPLRLTTLYKKKICF